MNTCNRMPRPPIPAIARLALLDTNGQMDDEIYSARFVRGLFDRMSRSYERMNLITSFGFSERWRRQMIALVTPTLGSPVVLDLMSGMGETWGALRRAIPEGNFHALDFSKRMIEHAQTRNESRFDDVFTLHSDDFLANTLSGAQFDVVVSAYGLKTFDTQQSRTFANELARILAPGGQFSFIEVAEPPHRLLRAAYDFYLSKVVPVVGRLLLSDPAEYRMLYRYVRAYGTGERSLAALTEHPLLTVERREHFFGCAVSFSGTRRPDR